MNVDIQAIISQAETKASEAAEKKMEAVFKSMLQQQGLDSDAIITMTADWKAKQVTPEQIIKTKDEEIQQRDGTISTLQQQIETERQEKLALSKGIPLGAEDEAVREKAIACISLAKSYMSDSVPFDSALEKALKIINFEEKRVPPPPIISMGAGTKQAPLNAIDPNLAAFAKGAGVKMKE